jgi:glutamate-1-semialdehyde 2,1-aminomutase
MASFGAFIESVKFMKKNNVIKKNGKYAETLIRKGNIISEKIGILDYFKFCGPVYNPNYICLNQDKVQSLEYKTLFMQEMINNGVLMPYISISYRHTEKDLKKTLSAIEKSLIVYKQAIKNGIDKYLIGSSIKPVFRKYN